MIVADVAAHGPCLEALGRHLGLTLRARLLSGSVLLAALRGLPPATWRRWYRGADERAPFEPGDEGLGHAWLACAAAALVARAADAGQPLPGPAAGGACPGLADLSRDRGWAQPSAWALAALRALGGGAEQEEEERSGDALAQAVDALAQAVDALAQLLAAHAAPALLAARAPDGFWTRGAALVEQLRAAARDPDESAADLISPLADAAEALLLDCSRHEAALLGLARGADLAHAALLAAERLRARHATGARAAPRLLPGRGPPLALYVAERDAAGARLAAQAARLVEAVYLA
jgi:hypothetical protein